MKETLKIGKIDRYLNFAYIFMVYNFCVLIMHAGLFSFTPQCGYTRPDIVFSFYEDTDDLAVDFVKASPGVIDYCEDVSDYILVSYDSNGKIVSVDIDEISKILQCHTFDVREEVDGKPPLTLNSIYYRDSDTLKVCFIDFIPPASTVCKKTDIEDIEMEVDGTGRMVCILFRNASERIAKPITEEERKNLALKYEEETKKLLKWSDSIVQKYDGKF
jgi:uncharacterized protein YuzE